MFCKRCGHELPDNGEVCPTCAHPARPVVNPSLGSDPTVRMLLPVGRSGWAVAAGYLGLFSVLLVFAPFALLTGILAIVDIRKHSEKHGMGRAVFGIIMGVLGTILLLAILGFALTR